MLYFAKNDYPPEFGWNFDGTQFAGYMSKRSENEVAFSLETAYFGTEGNKVSEEKLLALGHCFADALGRYMKTEG